MKTNFLVEIVENIREKPGKPGKPNKKPKPTKKPTSDVEQSESAKRLDRVFGNVNSWISANANKYKKKDKLLSIVARYDRNFINRL